MRNVAQPLPILIKPFLGKVHLFRIYRDRFGCKPGDLPLTEWVADHEITLPLYPAMTEEDVTYVTDSLKECLLATR